MEPCLYVNNVYIRGFNIIRLAYQFLVDFRSQPNTSSGSAVPTASRTPPEPSRAPEAPFPQLKERWRCVLIDSTAMLRPLPGNQANGYARIKSTAIHRQHPAPLI